MKRIWFVSHYSMPPEYEMRIKTQKYAQYFVDKGYDVRIFSASTIHNTDINLITDKKLFIEKQYGDLLYTHIRCRNYRGNGVKRILNMQDFCRRFKKVASNYEAPDVIVADLNCVHYYQIFKYCKKHNVKFLIDMRDLWPLSIVEYAGYSPKNPIIHILYKMEKKMYERCDGILFNIEGGYDYITDHKWEKSIPRSKVFYINNGVDIADFQKSIEMYRLGDSDLESDKFKVIYTGSIREANNIKAIYEAASKAKEENIDDVLFILYGTGPDKDLYQKLAVKQNLPIVFKGQVEKTFIPYILSKADVTILNYKKSKTLKYGGSQNKLFEYMAARKPVIVTIPMNYNLVDRHKCGITLNEPNGSSILEAVKEIKRLFEYNNSEYIQMCNNSYECATQFDFSILAKKLEDIILRSQK